jgi:hypothetical protein
MKKKFTLQQLEMMQRHFAQIMEKELPFKLTYKLAKIGKQIDSEMATYGSVRDKMLDKYGEKDDEGRLKIDANRVAIRKDSIETFAKEINEILASEVELVFDPLTLDDFNQMDNIKGTHLMVMQEFMNEG